MTHVGPPGAFCRSWGGWERTVLIVDLVVRISAARSFNVLMHFFVVFFAGGLALALVEVLDTDFELV